MKTKRITRTMEITIDRSRFFTDREPRPPTATWCEGCQAAATLLTPEVASLLLRLSLREMFRRVEAGDVHFTETRDGRLFICASSLFS